MTQQATARSTVQLNPEGVCSLLQGVSLLLLNQASATKSCQIHSTGVILLNIYARPVEVHLHPDLNWMTDFTGIFLQQKLDPHWYDTKISRVHVYTRRRVHLLDLVLFKKGQMSQYIVSIQDLLICMLSFINTFALIIKPFKFKLVQRNHTIEIFVLAQTVKMHKHWLQTESIHDVVTLIRPDSSKRYATVLSEESMLLYLLFIYFLSRFQTWLHFCRRKHITVNYSRVWLLANGLLWHWWWTADLGSV